MNTLINFLATLDMSANKDQDLPSCSTKRAPSSSMSIEAAPMAKINKLQEFPRLASEVLNSVVSSFDKNTMVNFGGITKWISEPVPRINTFAPSYIEINDFFGIGYGAQVIMIYEETVYEVTFVNHMKDSYQVRIKAFQKSAWTSPTTAPHHEELIKGLSSKVLNNGDALTAAWLYFADRFKRGYARDTKININCTKWPAKFTDLVEILAGSYWNITLHRTMYEEFMVFMANRAPILLKLENPICYLSPEFFDSPCFKNLLGFGLTPNREMSENDFLALDIGYISIRVQQYSDQVINTKLHQWYDGVDTKPLVYGFKLMEGEEREFEIMDIVAGMKIVDVRADQRTIYVQRKDGYMGYLKFTCRCIEFGTMSTKMDIDLMELDLHHLTLKEKEIFEFCDCHCHFDEITPFSPSFLRSQIFSGSPAV